MRPRLEQCSQRRLTAQVSLLRVRKELIANLGSPRWKRLVFENVPITSGRNRASLQPGYRHFNRKSDVSGKSVYGRVDPGGRGTINRKNNARHTTNTSSKDQ